MRHLVVMGNWKLNGSKDQVTSIILELEQLTKHDKSNVEIIIAPPVMYLDLAEQLLKNNLSKIKLGAQNIDSNLTGAFTGDISAAMLKEFSVSHVIVGHSERRGYHLESNATIAAKFAILKQQNITPVLCIGETESQNIAGQTLDVLKEQLDAIISTQGIKAFANTIIAYEPIWAIGTGKAATATQAQATHAAIRSHLASYDAEIANNITIQYGGSVKPENAKDFFAMPDIDGALVGGAALDAKKFAAIIQAQNK